MCASQEYGGGMSEDAAGDDSKERHNGQRSEPARRPDARPPTAALSHRVIEPSVLYVGTPAYLVATQNPDGTVNLAPASSHFALGRSIVLGLEEGGQSLDNVRRHGQLTVNFPSSDQWQHVERLAGVTGKYPVPADKPGYEFEPHKFERAGLTEAPSDLVDVPRVAEAPLQLEARVLRITDGAHTAGEPPSYGIVEAQVVRVHAAESITVPGTDHLDPEAWHPLIYAYRHFFDRGPEVGWTRKSPIARRPAAVDRWQLNGGSWRVQSAVADRAVVELRRCDGGEIADLITLTDPHDLRWARVQLAAAGADDTAEPTAPG